MSAKPRPRQLHPQLSRPAIGGTDVDEQGRCAHYRSVRDVVANKCRTCGTFWACYLCHAQAQSEELHPHEFSPMPRDEPAVLCGACGHLMDYAGYSGATAAAGVTAVAGATAAAANSGAAPSCPQCGHPFNPGCAAHTDIYFLPARQP